MPLTLDRTILLLIVAVLVALAARRLRLPYTVGLVVTGLALALARISTGAALTPEFIFGAILPPLLFEAALNIHWTELRCDALPILTLATLGVVISALVVAAGMTHLAGWPWPPALLFGILIAATDPVAVIAMFKDTGVVGRLRLLVEGESLLNDGVAAVLFVLALSWVESSGAAVTPAGVAQALAWTAGGGILVGLACGGLALMAAGRTADHLVETALTTVVAYGSFLLAEHLHVSGVLATVTAGLVMGNLGVLREQGQRHTLTDRGRAFVLEFWEFVAFLANSLIFLLIGLRVAAIPFRALGVGALIAAILLVLIGRALAVYPLCLPFFRSRRAVPLREQHILVWGGLRGALALALCLSLPRALLFRDEIVIATFGVVAFSVVVQGLTMPWLLRRLALLPRTPK
ncbi:MAG: sodium:proton antiporter [Armatimonadota bacterium]|nr:sodium:proton antiporter [Armatimonadota bacterium]